MLPRQLVAALIEARRQMPGEAWQSVTEQLTPFPANPDPSSIRQATAGLVNRDAAWILDEAFRQNCQVKWAEIAVAMGAVDCFVDAGTPLLELIWTGPPNKRFPVRRLDQVLYDLVVKARSRIVLVTFAAHRVPHLCEHLAAAVKRGVHLTLIVESEGESEGQLTHDAVSAFKNVPTSGTNIYYWPLAKRERNQTGRPGKLHMKCAIIDEVALIGSANLTDDAFNRNMELGIVIRERSTVKSISEHLAELIQGKVLVPICR